MIQKKKKKKKIPQNYTAQHKHHAELLQSMSLCPTFMQDCICVILKLSCSQ